MLSVLRTVAKDLFFSIKRTPLGERASILSYHNIGLDKAFFTVSPSNLQKQVDYLVGNNFSIVSLTQLVEKVRSNQSIGNSIVLTFNDGYESVYTHVFPLLKKHNLPASVFLGVEYIDTTVQTSDNFSFKTLSMSQIREMLASGLVEFFPQTQHRVALDSVAYEGAAMKIDQARAELESVVQKDARVFSFPKGRYTQKLIEHLKEAGWLGAVTSKEGLVHADSDLFILPRNSVDSKTTFIQFKGKVSGAIEAYSLTKN